MRGDGNGFELGVSAFRPSDRERLAMARQNELDMNRAHVQALEVNRAKRRCAARRTVRRVEMINRAHKCGLWLNGFWNEARRDR